MYEKSVTELNSLCAQSSMSRLLRADSVPQLFPQRQKSCFTLILLYLTFLPSPSVEMPAAGRALQRGEGGWLGWLPPLAAQGLEQSRAEPARSKPAVCSLASSLDGPLPLLRGQTHANL